MAGSSEDVTDAVDGLQAVVAAGQFSFEFFDQTLVADKTHGIDGAAPPLDVSTRWGVCYVLGYPT